MYPSSTLNDLGDTMTPDQITHPQPSIDTIAQVAQQIGSWAVVACVALFVAYKLGVAYIDLLKARDKDNNERLTKLEQALETLTKDQRQDTELLNNAHKLIKLDVDRAHALIDKLDERCDDLERDIKKLGH